MDSRYNSYLKVTWPNGSLIGLGVPLRMHVDNPERTHVDPNPARPPNRAPPQTGCRCVRPPLLG